MLEKTVSDAIPPLMHSLNDYIILKETISSYIHTIFMERIINIVNASVTALNYLLKKTTNSKKTLFD